MNKGIVSGTQRPSFNLINDINLVFERSNISLQEIDQQGCIARESQISTSAGGERNICEQCQLQWTIKNIKCTAFPTI